MNTFLELIGYAGTALVLLSMMMTSMNRLRLVNSCGSLLSMIYAIFMGAWPVVLLNGGIIIINCIQLWRTLRKKEHKEVTQ